MEMGAKVEVGGRGRRGTFAHGQSCRRRGVTKEHGMFGLHPAKQSGPDLLFKYRGKGGDC